MTLASSWLKDVGRTCDRRVTQRYYPLLATLSRRDEFDNFQALIYSVKVHYALGYNGRAIHYAYADPLGRERCPWRVVKTFNSFFPYFDFNMILFASGQRRAFYEIEWNFTSEKL